MRIFVLFISESDKPFSWLRTRWSYTYWGRAYLIGDEDPFTPIDGDVGTFFQKLAAERVEESGAADIKFVRIPGNELEQ